MTMFKQIFRLSSSAGTRNYLKAQVTSSYNFGNICNSRWTKTATDVKLFSENSQADTKETLLLEKLSEESKSQLAKLKADYESRLLMGGNVPSRMRDKDWLNLLEAKNKTKYLTFLFKNEKKTENEKKKKAIRYEKHLQKVEEKKKLRQEGLVESRPFFTIRKATLKKFYANNLFHALMNGPRVIVDLGFEEVMDLHSKRSLGRQLQMMHVINETRKEPAHVHFCNLSKSSRLYDLLSTNFGEIITRPYYSFDEKDCWELYPPEQLVYLTPDARSTLKEFKEDDVYVIGGLVDRGHNHPLTKAKAKKLGIRTAKLPLDFIRIESGSSKALNLDTVFAILLDLRSSNDWSVALRNIPTRKIKKAPIKALNHIIQKFAK